MGFGITPVAVGPFPGPTDTGFPQFLQWQSGGTDLGGPDVDTVNVVGSVTATRGTGENENVVTLQGADVPPNAAWIDAPGDYVISIANRNGCIATTGTTGTQTIFVPTDTGDELIDLPDAAAILVYQEGAAGVNILAVAPGTVTINLREVFSASSAGQFATLTLIKRGANNWVLCGDLATAP